MASAKPAIPKGTRDFTPQVMVKRNFIFDTIKNVFKKFGYQEIQTPVMENLGTLTGKYGDEGDQLIFKILNSGDYLKDLNLNETAPLNSKTLLTKISEKALRYDLTVPFARYVVMHQHEITMPFKRFQIQPVWRADRPQRGRYREFYQCDADVVGSNSLLNEAEFICIYDEVLSNLGFADFSIKINNRKILSGIAQIIGKPALIVDMTVAIDKLDKIGFEGVKKELLERGFTDADINKLQPVIELSGNNTEKINALKTVLAQSEVGLKGISEIETVLNYVSKFSIKKATIELDITLARGLNYYTGSILEVKTNQVQIGSIGGGGRYDDLTGMFGLKDLTGVGISFGADRIYDVMEELNLFPAFTTAGTEVLICPFGEEEELYALPLLQKLRGNNIKTELYPAGAKLKKQMQYANDKNIAFTIVIGPEEMQKNNFTLKDMKSGVQQQVNEQTVIYHLKNK